MRVTTRSLTRWALVVAALAGSASAAGAQGTAIQPLDADDPRAEVAGRVAAVLLGGSRTAVDEHLRSRATPEYLASASFEASVAAAMGAVSRPGLAVQSFASGPGDHVLVRLEGSATPTGSVFVAVGVEPSPPHRVTGLALPNIMMGPPPGAAPLARVGADERTRVVEELAILLEQLYAIPSTGSEIASHIRREAERGAFESETQPHEFAVALTRAMRAINGDLHLAVIPPAAGSSGMQAGGADAQRQANYALPRVEVLEGNIGYVRVSGFSPAPAATERLGQALTFLQDTDAVIIDLRGVRGGAEAMSNAIISHFTPPDVPTLRVWSRLTGQTTVTSTLPVVPGPRRTDVPLYILVDGDSGSAAEHVPFVLQNLGRATIVGGRTAGAGRNNVMRSLPFGFVASISHSRVQEYGSDREWEGVGVQPDLPTDPDRALDAAVEHAREQLGRNH
jgi:hypothetical protein